MGFEYRLDCQILQDFQNEQDHQIILINKEESYWKRFEFCRRIYESIYRFEAELHLKRLTV